MKKNILFTCGFLILLFLFCACNRKAATPCAQLLDIEQMLEIDADSARNLMDQFSPETADKFNRAFYYLLYVQATSKKQEKVYLLDSLLNYALKEFESAREKKLLAQALILKGESWEELQSPQEATECYLQALKLLEESSNYTLILYAYTSLGYIYFEQDLPDEALNTFRSCYEAMLPDTCERNKFISLKNMGYIHLYFENSDSILHYFEKAMHHAKKSRDSVELKDILYNDLAYYYKEEEQYEKSLTYLNKITNISAKSYLIKGDIYSLQHEYDSAFYYARLSINSDDLPTQRSGHYLLYKLEEELENYEKALTHLHTYMEVNDSLSAHIYTSETHAINHKHRIQKEIQKVENRHKLRIIILAGLFTIALLLIGTTTILQSRKRKMKQAQEMAQKEKFQKEKEISGLYNQIADTRHTTLRLKHEHKHTAELQQKIEEQENSLHELHNQVDQLRIHLFTSSPIYKKIQRLTIQENQDSVSVFPTKEREELKNTIQKIYTDLPRELSVLCPSLTEEDRLFCCLAKLNFSLPLIGACTGYARVESARQRRYRISKKMFEATQSEDLYNSFFTHQASSK